MFTAMLLASMLNITPTELKPLTNDEAMRLAACETFTLPQSDRWVTSCPDGHGGSRINAIGDFLGNVRFRNSKSDLGWSFATIDPNDLDIPSRK